MTMVLAGKLNVTGYNLADQPPDIARASHPAGHVGQLGKESLRDLEDVS
jgi:hypothetical protein